MQTECHIKQEIKELLSGSNVFQREKSLSLAQVRWHNGQNVEMAHFTICASLDLIKPHEYWSHKLYFWSRAVYDRLLNQWQ